MVIRHRVAAQHEDWLNLAAPESPWFAVPAVKRAFPNGLDGAGPDVRAGHKMRWNGDERSPGARLAPDRGEYLEWLLRDALGWGDGYLVGNDLPPELAAGVTRHEVTVVPTGAYRPPSVAPLGLFDDEAVGGPGPAGRVRALVFLLPAGTDPGARPPRDAWPASWVQRAALACRHHGVPLALVTDGDHLTLVYAEAATATGWGSWRASEFASEPVLLDSFVSMLGARRFSGVADADTPEALLAESVGSQAEVTNTLGRQVRRAVELLVNAISRADRDRGGALLAGVGPHQVYEAAVTVLMRTVFLLVAEENGLLPVDNAHYQALYAIRTLREDLLAESFTNPEALESRCTAWYRLLATSRAVHTGVRHHDLSVPGYGGTLFDPGRFPFLEGRSEANEGEGVAGAPIAVTDLDVLAILDALLVLRFRSAAGVTETRRLSYRQVDVEQVGHIYERLLDHDAVVATEVVLGLVGRADDEPEVALSAVEGKRMDGAKALVDFLSDDKDKWGGVYSGTRRQVESRLAEPANPHLRASVLEACNGDLTLARRVEPYAGLLRLDLRDRPLVFLPGAVFVTETGHRRDSGTAYTTRGLADEVAEHALAPLCYSPGPQDTPDTNRWRIRPAGEILALKVCDPAVGSGAILVAACRYLAERLVEAWRAEGDLRAADLATAADDPSRLDVVVQARRLVAESCCYGVDRNPMAVEMAKLSMWLTTVARDRPFSFLDHALKAGDSMLGLWRLDQLRWLHLDVAEGRRRAEHERYALPGLDPRDAWKRMEPLVDRALELRAEVHALATATTADVEHKAALHRRSEAALAALGAVADVLAGAALAGAGKADPAAALRELLAADAGPVAAVIDAAGTPEQAAAVEAARARARRRLDAGRPPGSPSRAPLHWPLAFPEVFTGDRPGFDAMVGNPPFVGGQKISGAAGIDVRNYLVAWVAGGARGSADLVAYFFLRAADLARSFGYLATNTIAQGDTSEVGLAQLIDRGLTIHRAVSSTTWPGEATLEIAKVWTTGGSWAGERVLDGRPVVGIDEMLYAASRSGWRKQRLVANADQSFQGSIVLGLGFTMSPDEAQDLIAKDPRNAEVLFPYLGGEDLNESPTHSAPRWIINFFDWPEAKARTYPDCYAIVEERVKPERAKVKDAAAKRWWQYLRPRPELYRRAAGLDRVCAIARVSKTVQPALVSPRQVLNEKIVVFPTDSLGVFGFLCSAIHFRWAVRHGTTLRTDPQYTPSDVYETIPVPELGPTIADAGEALDTFRAALMVERGEGLTKTYNRVHDTDNHDAGIAELRRLHLDLDLAVRDAYGWHGLDLGHGFHPVRGQGIRFTLSPEAADEVLDRLLELNRDRYQAEVAAGLHDRRPARARSAATATLFDDEEPDA